MDLENKSDCIYYNGFFKNNALIMLLIDQDTLNISDANGAACCFYKYNYNELLKLKISDIDISTEVQLITKFDSLSKTNSIIKKHRISSGEIKDVIVNAEKILINDKKYIQAIVFDVSESEREVKEIIETSELYSQFKVMLDNLPFIAWFKDKHGNYTVVNKPFEDYCGLCMDEIIGKNDYDIFPKEEADLYIFSDNKIISGRTKGHFEENYKEGRWKEEYKSPVIDQYGNIIGSTGISRDITESKLIVKKLLEAEQKERHLLEETIKIKNNFITLITHEFKTPLSIINAAIQTMDVVCSDEMSAKMRGYINKIKQNSLRQQRLVDNLLDITRLKAGHMKVTIKNIDIVSYTKEIVDSVKVFALQKDIRITYKSTCQRKTVQIDDEKYERILLNLLSNAIKFTPTKKNIDVKLSFTEEKLQIEVKDRGIGIPEDKQNIIFEQFGQADSSLSRQSEGTGIGLYLVKSLVDTLGGTISLSSKKNHGSTFFVSIPVKQEELESQDHKIYKDKIKKSASLEFSDIIF